ncbi:MAG: bifunctional hydroxymethylpyrimidine kinase/phosphomethylpyrimidine kinase [Methanocalculus sp. MSAO_Arc1]|uniref:bifunctional hydroxymethylpyrimidine kinase/phosphomethylpyrimidine kinase n=1 Tax=Methanocalculus TaxID=71151 RepID=UPI000FF06788|nr:MULTISPECIES: bifunctional hydroxymethylpyrimidine kinase/phosphomethylpyrimidine kinase [unclassified Methanocalculus]MCP1661842.1 hydroxymethylpyrimidine/phosphomethylpyrimidine kinase [Methanocalculus sp. AMF5]RQD81975.1 MAG: bifunctional hydroxymethylpyrimidine kinase/phosphomethylpyrimidine kinase [Methanocalculus sp. MSAO_Arc1]
MSGEGPYTACSIAGSDSGGGAGIQADLKTFAAYGVYGLSVVTAVTAQNTGRVAGAWVQSGESVAVQMATLCEEFHVSAWKTGMLGTPGVIEAVIDNLPAGAELVLDPVIVSTSGHRLLSEDALTLLIEGLLPVASLVTPNIPEAEALTGLSPICNLDDMREAGSLLLAGGAGAVIVKGGHLEGGEATDILLDSHGEMVLSGPRYPYAVHGSGCTFAAALTAERACGRDAQAAFQGAKRFIDGAIRHAIRFSSGGTVPDPFFERSRTGNKPIH